MNIPEEEEIAIRIAIQGVEDQNIAEATKQIFLAHSSKFQNEIDFNESVKQIKANICGEKVKNVSQREEQLTKLEHQKQSFLANIGAGIDSVSEFGTIDSTICSYDAERASLVEQAHHGIKQEASIAATFQADEQTAIQKTGDVKHLF